MIGKEWLSPSGTSSSLEGAEGCWKTTARREGWTKMGTRTKSEERAEGRTSDGPACDALAHRSAHTLAACSGTRVAITVTKLLTARAKLR